MTNLKHCPFCGNKHLIVASYTESNGTFEKSRYAIKCTKCGAMSGKCDELWEAKSKWDKRSPESAEKNPYGVTTALL